jgi:hypothetical protein
MTKTLTEEEKLRAHLTENKDNKRYLTTAFDAVGLEKDQDNDDYIRHLRRIIDRSNKDFFTTCVLVQYLWHMNVHQTNQKDGFKALSEWLRTQKDIFIDPVEISQRIMVHDTLVPFGQTGIDFIQSNPPSRLIALCRLLRNEVFKGDPSLMSVKELEGHRPVLNTILHGVIEDGVPVAELRSWLAERNLVPKGTRSTLKKLKEDISEERLVIDRIKKADTFQVAGLTIGRRYRRDEMAEARLAAIWKALSDSGKPVDFLFDEATTSLGHKYLGDDAMQEIEAKFKEPDAAAA